MSQLRQSENIAENSLIIRTLGVKFLSGHIIKKHKHKWGQLIFATQGVMQVDVDNNRLQVSPMRCLWMPAEIDHSIKIAGETWMRTVYIKPNLIKGKMSGYKILNVAPLLRELIIEIVKLKMLSSENSDHINLANVLIDQISSADEISMNITMPIDSRALELANIIIDDPANKSPLATLSRSVGASPRTLERLFVKDTGLTIGRWRQQARLMMSIRLLVSGNSVKQAAYESGYESPSAFVSMFRREFALTPGQYVRKFKSK